MGTALFPLGDLVATPGALAALHRTHCGVWTYLSRHITGDWGELDAHDRAENELSLREGFRLLSAYGLPDGTRNDLSADNAFTVLINSSRREATVATVAETPRAMEIPKP